MRETSRRTITVTDRGADRDPLAALLALRLARHLRDIQAEDGCDLVGQESNDLMWWVARHFGLRIKLVEHAAVGDCPWTGKHHFSECGSELAVLDFEVGDAPGTDAPTLAELLHEAHGPASSPPESWLAMAAWLLAHGVTVGRAPSAETHDEGCRCECYKRGYEDA
jgi:hypothetical protein